MVNNFFLTFKSFHADILNKWDIFLVYEHWADTISTAWSGFALFATGPVVLDIQEPASVAQVDVCWVRQHYFVEIDLKIFSTVILVLPLIKEGQLSVSDERMCTSTDQLLHFNLVITLLLGDQRINRVS